MASKLLVSKEHGDHLVSVRGEYEEFGFDGNPQVTLSGMAYYRPRGYASINRAEFVENPTKEKVIERAESLICEILKSLERKAREQEITDGLPDSLDELLGGDGE